MSVNVEVAAAVLEPTRPTPAESRSEIERLIEAYRAAFEARDIAAVRRAYPGMTGEQENGWSTFFGDLRELTVTFQPPDITLGDDTAEATVQTTWDYRADRTGNREFAQVFQFQYQNGGWAMTGWGSN